MEPEFIRLQREFTRHLRDPEHVDPPGSHEARRLAIYQNAIYHNVAGLMGDNYPRIKNIMNEADFEALIRDYIVRHEAKASAFIDVPREFLDYLEHQREGYPDPPFLFELAHFDWLETLVGADQRQLDYSDIDADGDLIEGIPIANPIMVEHTYYFPVHAINSDYKPLQAPPTKTHIAAYRDPNNLYGFLDLNPASARLLNAVTKNALGDDMALTGKQILLSLAEELGVADNRKLLKYGREILLRMSQRGAILGTFCPPAT